MAEAEAAEKLYTLTEVAKKTNISMPTLQRYKKMYQDRIPSVGKGRSQRYPEEALDVFRQLKKENIRKRGRPRKNAAKAASAKRATGSKRGRKADAEGGEKPTEGLLTLTQISKMTGISYPTLLRYVKTHLKDIPHKGTGRARRYLPDAVDVFKKLRGQSKRGRKKGSTAAKGKAGRRASADASGPLLDRIKELEKSQKRLEKLIERQQKQIEKPFKVVLQRK
jgi:predicted DNA-binding transcriptional regulator AlpA